MPGDWPEAIDLGDHAPAAEEAAAEDEQPAERGGRFRRLRERLSASRKALADELTASVLDRLDDADWERLEEALILADVGASTTAGVVGRLEAEVESGGLSDPAAVRERLVELLAEVASVGERRLDLGAQPAVVMVVGVNGTGKTTTIGKLASILGGELGQKVIVAAAD